MAIFIKLGYYNFFFCFSHETLIQVVQRRYDEGLNKASYKGSNRRLKLGAKLEKY